MRRILLAMAAAVAVLLAAPPATGPAQAASAENVREAAGRLAGTAAAVDAQYAQHRRHGYGHYRPRHHGYGHRRYYRPRFYGGHGYYRPRFHGGYYGHGYRRHGW